MSNYNDTLDWTNEETHAMWANLVSSDLKARVDQAIADDIRMYEGQPWPAGLASRSVALRECASAILFGDDNSDGVMPESPLAAALVSAALARVDWMQVAERIPCELSNAWREDGSYYVAVQFTGRN